MLLHAGSESKEFFYERGARIIGSWANSGDEQPRIEEGEEESSRPDRACDLVQLSHNVERDGNKDQKSPNQSSWAQDSQRCSAVWKEE